MDNTTREIMKIFQYVMEITGADFETVIRCAKELEIFKVSDQELAKSKTA